jgi:NAD(P)-dependent dehydrogenase (short-subunit alcohol dehydrogenase family)
MKKLKIEQTPTDGCVWITGASSGIGRALAVDMCRAGWKVIATARRREDLDNLAAELKGAKGQIWPFPADIIDGHAIAEIVREVEEDIAPIAIAILNAGVYLPIEAIDLSENLDAFKSSLDVNLMGTANSIAPLMEPMKARGYGQIGIVSSVTGYGGLPTCMAYGATKAALINMAECMAIELAPHGIRTTLINPGFVDTPAQDDLNFPKPFMIDASDAARRIIRGLRSRHFEITFPRRFTWPLKAFNNFLPKALYLRLIRFQTRPRSG